MKAVSERHHTAATQGFILNQVITDKINLASDFENAQIMSGSPLG